MFNFLIKIFTSILDRWNDSWAVAKANFFEDLKRDLRSSFIFLFTTPMGWFCVFLYFFILFSLWDWSDQSSADLLSSFRDAEQLMKERGMNWASIRGVVSAEFPDLDINNAPVREIVDLFNQISAKGALAASTTPCDAASAVNEMGCPKLDISDIPTAASIDFANLRCYATLEPFQFKTGFCNNKAYVLVYLSLWQYWWWAWFTFIIVFYYILAYKHLIMRQLKLYPKINTSIKSHGKWGDFIVASIPVFWCANILVNSNALLKIFEWQYESNFLNLRVRGKQWYWVYKFDFSNLETIGSLKRGVGRGFFAESTSRPFRNANLVDYFTFLWQQRQYSKYKIHALSSNRFNNKSFWHQAASMSYLFTRGSFRPTFAVFFENHLAQRKTSFFLVCRKILDASQHYSFYKKNPSIRVSLNFSIFLNRFFYKFFGGSRDFGAYNKSYTLRSLSDLLYSRTCFFDLIWPDYLYRGPNLSYSLSLKQKRVEFSAKSRFGFYNFFSKHDGLLLSFKKHNSSNLYLSINRLLSTNFTLVLPANVVTAVISNSFDVVHSWFIPGLGIKIDCVPGKSTHHSFFFDVCGLFYGQCAEVCGRFHHHMPIKVCVVHFEHFIVWVNHVLVRFIFSNKTR